MDELVQITPLPSGKKCLVKDCENRQSQGLFFGDVCAPCYAFLTGRKGGEWSQAFRNAMGAAGTLLRERSTYLNASQLLLNYHKGVLRYAKN